MSKNITNFVLIIVWGCSWNSDPQPTDQTMLPTITTLEVLEITAHSAIGGGVIETEGGQLILAKGLVWSEGMIPTMNDYTSNGLGEPEFQCVMTNLKPNTTYYVNAYATNINGTSFGIIKSFTTFSGEIILTTNSISTIRGESANCGGEITSDGGEMVLSRGICWSEQSVPTISDFKTLNGNGSGYFFSELTNLVPAHKYYVRAYATNDIGTFYGSEVTFTTLGGPITDADNNTYTSIAIGSQIWLVESIITTKYSTGDPIPGVPENAQWINQATGAWCSYNNDNQKDVPYGKLYNWYAINDPRKLCPIGWHVPSDDEFLTLINYVGGESDAGYKLKSTSHYWDPPNQSDNSSGFTAQPAGWRSNQWEPLGIQSNFWSITEHNQGVAVLMLAFTTREAKIMTTYTYWNNGISMQLPLVKEFGFSVRCLGD